MAVCFAETLKMQAASMAGLGLSHGLGIKIKSTNNNCFLSQRERIGKLFFKYFVIIGRRFNSDKFHLIFFAIHGLPFEFSQMLQKLLVENKFLTFENQLPKNSYH